MPLSYLIWFEVVEEGLVTRLYYEREVAVQLLYNK